MVTGLGLARHPTRQGANVGEHVNVERAKGAVGEGVRREHVLARRRDGVGLGARAVEEEVHRPGVKERERAVDDLGVNVTEHATSTKAVELEDVHPELLGALGGERIEVEAETQLLDRIGRQLRELGRFHEVDSTARRTNRVSSRTLAVTANAQLNLGAARDLDEARRATVTRNDVRDDRKSESGAARSTASRRVRSNESLEELRALRHVDTFAVVGDRDDGEGTVVMRIEAKFVRRVPRGVVDDVADHPLQHRRIARHPGRLHGRGVDAEFTHGAYAQGLLEQEVVEVYVDAHRFDLVLVVAREPEEVLDQAVEATTLAHDRLGDFGPVDALLFALGPLDGGEQRRQGAAQFVTGVRDELLLKLRSRLEPVEHGVDGARHARDLVVATGHRHPFGEVARRDSFNAASNRLDRRQRETDAQPDETARQQQQQREGDGHADEQDAHTVRDGRPVDVTEDQTQSPARRDRLHLTIADLRFRARYSR